MLGRVPGAVGWGEGSVAAPPAATFAAQPNLDAAWDSIPSECRECPIPDIVKTSSPRPLFLVSPPHLFFLPLDRRTAAELITPTLGASVLGDTSSPHMDYAGSLDGTRTVLIVSKPIVTS